MLAHFCHWAHHSGASFRQQKERLSIFVVIGVQPLGRSGGCSLQVQSFLRIRTGLCGHGCTCGAPGSAPPCCVHNNQWAVSPCARVSWLWVIFTVIEYGCYAYHISPYNRRRVYTKLLCKKVGCDHYVK